MSKIESAQIPQTMGWDTIKCDIVLVKAHSVDKCPYIVTCWDSHSGVILGAKLVASRPDGESPRPTLSDLVEIMGGRYRYASVRVDIETRMVSKKMRRIARSLRRLHNAGSLKQLERGAALHLKRTVVNVPCLKGKR